MSHFNRNRRDQVSYFASPLFFGDRIAGIRQSSQSTHFLPKSDVISGGDGVIEPCTKRPCSRLGSPPQSRFTVQATRVSPACQESCDTGPRTPGLAHRCTRAPALLGAPSSSRPSRAKRRRTHWCGALRGNSYPRRCSRSLTSWSSEVASRALDHGVQSEQSKDEAHRATRASQDRFAT